MHKITINANAMKNALADVHDADVEETMEIVESNFENWIDYITARGINNNIEIIIDYEGSDWGSVYDVEPEDGDFQYLHDWFHTFCNFWEWY